MSKNSISKESKQKAKDTISIEGIGKVSHTGEFNMQAFIKEAMKHRKHWRKAGA
ncbi:hypothetical protein ACTWQL_19385 [Pseudalkalibacillus sp. R45]|uniref:hypothetical protein n=1 Tax=Pseudalkalibacillus sp. R45 TaxID=3457433 RepID=UPI003FCCCB09